LNTLKQLELQNKKILVFANSIEQCDFATRHLKKAGYSAFSYHSKVDSSLSEAAMDSFRNNTAFIPPDDSDKNLFNYDKETETYSPIKVLVSISKLTTGFSVNDIDVGILLNKTLVKSRFNQICGRLYRKAEGKPHGVIIDLGQNVSTHGLPHEPYSPPERVLDSKTNSETIYKLNEKHGMPGLVATLDKDELKPVNREVYVKKINEIKADDTRLSNMSLKALVNKLEVESDPKIIIAIIAVLFDKIHSSDMVDKWGRQTRGYVAINGKDVINFVNSDSIMWIAEPWIEVMESDKYSEIQKKKWVNSLKTRAKNILKEKKSIWSLKFFIEWLLEKHVQDNQGVYDNTIYDTDKKETVTVDIDEADIPF
jgi:hypothetical protein